jgi:hypothetical protein
MTEIPLKAVRVQMAVGLVGNQKNHVMNTTNIH